MIHTRRLAATAGAAIAVLLASPALYAQDDDKPADTAATTATPEKEELICRTEKVIGSRAKKRRICMTERQWREVAYRGGNFSRALVESGRSGMWLDNN